jgi:predicted cobalt transporter CbtA
MLAAYLTDGLKAGLVAGLVFGLFMAFVANPLVVHADERNHAAVADDHGHEAAGADGDHAHETAGAQEGPDAGPVPVTEFVSVVSGGLWAVLLGIVCFGIAFYFLEPVIPGTGATKSYVLGVAGFITVSGAPWLVLPPVSPGSEQPIPVDTRLLLSSVMMIAGAVSCLLAGRLYNRLYQSRGQVLASGVAVLPFGALLLSAQFAPQSTVEHALAPELQQGLNGLFVFGQMLVWLVLSTMHAQLRSTARTGSQPASSIDSAVTAD